MPYQATGIILHFFFVSGLILLGIFSSVEAIRPVLVIFHVFT